MNRWLNKTTKVVSSSSQSSRVSPSLSAITNYYSNSPTSINSKSHTIFTMCKSSSTLSKNKTTLTYTPSSSNQTTKISHRSFSSSSKNKSTFPKWPQPVVESHGDYREEAYLEQIIGGPLYANQKNLPRLPIPTIQETISSLIPTALPLALNDDEKSSFIQACNLFPQQASSLHQRLHDRRDGDMKDSSWLQLWWNTTGYLQVRDTIVVNVSYFFHFSDDDTLASQLHQQPNHNKSLGVLRGASILYSVAEFRKLLCTGVMPCETIGKKDNPTNLCSVAFKYMFNACRIPHRIQDSYKIHDPSLHQHVVVAYKGNFYTFDFVDTQGNPLPLNVLEDRLQQCVIMGDKSTTNHKSLEADQYKLGWLTSSDRDSWADARVELLRVGGEEMNSSLKKLESAAIMLCLDDEEPVSRKECANIFWTGGLKSGHNRWFDKSIQIMCTKNGKAGLIGEHSMMDGMPALRLADYITKQTYHIVKQKNNELTSSLSSSSSGGNVGESVENVFQKCLSNINWSDSKLKTMIEKAKADFTTLITDHSLDVQSFQGYGSTYIKKMGYSPDAFVQMAIQLATYRLFKEGNQVGTYEASQMRPFLHGRTETTRAVSLESEAFVKRMGLCPTTTTYDEASRKEKLSLLRAAVDAHVKYLSKASKGKGVDRHLFGMSMLVEGPNEEAPTLYSHPLYQRAKRWRVSTSHLTHPKFENWGFGEVFPDGVGIGYAVKADSCIFNITARRENDWTDSLSHLLEEALLEMRLLNDLDGPLQSKL